MMVRVCQSINYSIHGVFGVEHVLSQRLADPKALEPINGLEGHPW